MCQVLMFWAYFINTLIYQQEKNKKNKKQTCEFHFISNFHASHTASRLYNWIAVVLPFAV